MLVVLIVDFFHWSTRPSSPHLSSSSQLMIQNQQVRPAVVINSCFVCAQNFFLVSWLSYWDVATKNNLCDLEYICSTNLDILLILELAENILLDFDRLSLIFNSIW